MSSVGAVIDGSGYYLLSEVYLLYVTSTELILLSTLDCSCTCFRYPLRSKKKKEGSMGWDSSVGYGDLLRAGWFGNRIPVGGETFRTPPDRSSDPTSILYDEYWVIPGVKRPGLVVNHPPHSSAEVKERVELYIYSPSAFMACYRLNFTFHIQIYRGC